MTNAEFDVTGMLNMYSRCVREGRLSLQRTLSGISAIQRVGITLFVDLQGLW